MASRSRTFVHLGLLAAPLLLFTGCAPMQPAPAAGAEEPHWTYSGVGGPEQWGTLSPEFAICETGTTQSPIDLANATRADLPDLRFDYGPATPLRIVNLGHTVQVNYQPGSSITVNDTTYELLQFHFHTPAEHRLQGREFPAELHLVHRAPGGALAVVGVLIERGSPNAAAAPLWNHLPRTPGAEQQVASARIDAADLLPADRQRYQYPGSLTTPPCTEGVKWLVLAESIEMSAEQIDALQSIIGTSNRPVQPLGDRELRLGT